MVALSLQASKIPQKGETKTEKTYESIRASNHILNDFRNHLHDVMLYLQQWLGATR